MLGLLILYFFAKEFYKLAILHNKNKWLFAILSIVVYYAATIITGIAIAIANAMWGDGSLIDDKSFLLNLIAMPFGLLAVWGFYKMLKRAWENKDFIEDSEIIDAEIIE
jgi:hypothetical protein